MLRLNHVSKRLRGRQALDDISLEVAHGEVIGLLGANGAGKSTMLGIVIGQVFADSGTVEIDGTPANEPRARDRIGAVWESPGFYEQLSGWENLNLLASYSREVTSEELHAVVEVAGLTERIGDRVRTYSHGMRRRLALAQSLVPRPKFLLLDEPLDGLDPLALREWRHVFTRLRQEHGTTVLLSSHQLSEVEKLCDRVLILREGRLVFDGRWPEGQSLEDCYVEALTAK